MLICKFFLLVSLVMVCPDLCAGAKPENVLHRDYFHWHSEMALRLIDFFGERGSKKAGLLTPDMQKLASFHSAKNHVTHGLTTRCGPCRNMEP